MYGLFELGRDSKMLTESLHGIFEIRSNLQSFDTMTRARLQRLFLGFACVAVFFGMQRTIPGLAIEFRAPFTYSSAGELQFWLGYFVLLFPGGVLIASALLPKIDAWTQRATERVAAFTAQETAATLAALGVVVMFAAYLGQLTILNGHPLTDDEYTTRFGGQLLASGRVFLPMFEAAEAFPGKFMWQSGNLITPFDWPGPQFAWAIGETLGVEGLVFAIGAGLGVAGLCLAIGGWHGRGYGWMGIVIALSSPMFVALSWTTHSHVWSRGCLAMAIGMWVLSEKNSKLSYYAAVGGFLGMGFLFRPTEVGASGLPIVLAALWRLREGPEAGRLAKMGALVGTGAIFVGVFFAYNYAVTGSLMPPRFVPNDWVDYPGLTLPGPLDFLTDTTVLMDRLSVNIGYNGVLLAIWALGPAGIVFFLIGLGRDRISRVLTVSLVGHFALGLAHDNHGIHSVGPIHYSEAIVPYSIIAVTGVRYVIENHRSIASSVRAAVAGSLVAGFAFHGWHGMALHESTAAQEEIYGFVGRIGGSERALVLAPDYAAVRNAIPRLQRPGSWVFHWRPVDPTGERRVEVVLSRGADLAALRRDFPRRRFFQLRRAPERGLEIVPLEVPDGPQ